MIPANARLNTGFFNGLEAGTIVTENNPTLLGTDEGGIYLQENNVPVTLLLYYGHNTTSFEFKNNDGEVLDTVTTISAGAFANADGITAVVIPASVTTIGEEAFRGNTEIDTVTFTAGGTAPLSIGKLRICRNGTHHDCASRKRDNHRRLCFCRERICNLHRTWRYKDYRRPCI